jgi:hypothetical protein
MSLNFPNPIGTEICMNPIFHATSENLPKQEIPAFMRKIRLRSDEASDYLEYAHGLTVATRTLDKYRSVGGGPEFQKFNRSVFYHRNELDAWALGKLGKPLRNTSEAA